MDSVEEDSVEEDRAEEDSASHKSQWTRKDKTRQGQGQGMGLSEQIVGRLFDDESSVRAQLHAAAVPVRVQHASAHTSTAVLDDPLDAHD